MMCEKCGAPMPEGVEVCPVCGWAPAAAEAAGESAETIGETAVEAVEETVEAAAEALEEAVEEAVGAADAVEEAAEDVAETVEEAAEELLDAAEAAPEKKKLSRGAITALVLGAAAVVAAIVIALCLFAGPKKAADPTDKVIAQIDCLPDNAVDVSMETIGVPADSVLLTVAGKDVTAEEYLYWLGNITSYYEMVTSYSGAEMDLTREAQPGVTWDQQLKDAARDNTILLALVADLAEEYGVTLSDEDAAGIAETRDMNIEASGGTEMYAYQLQCMGINDVSAMRLNATSVLYNKFQDAWLEQTAAGLTAEEMAAYVEENDLLRAKHILLMTMDMSTGASLGEEEKAAKRAEADDILAQLRADSTKFDALMQEKSEDTGLAAYPDGYLFTAGEMVPEFENGTRALAFGEISDIIESSYGYHIILRLDPDCDETRRSVATERFNTEIQSRVDAAEVTYADAYDTFTTADYYEKLRAFQQSLAEPEVADQSQAELTPAAGS